MYWLGVTTRHCPPGTSNGGSCVRIHIWRFVTLDTIEQQITEVTPAADAEANALTEPEEYIYICIYHIYIYDIYIYHIYIYIYLFEYNLI